MRTVRIPLFCSCLLISYCMLAQTTDQTIRFVNYGKMNVAVNTAGPVENKVSLYVPYSLSVIGNDVDIVQNGISTLGGNFNNDVTSNNVFEAASIGTFRFFGTTDIQNVQGTANREISYIDFPNAEVNKSAGYVKLASSMGMNTDGLNLKSGKLQLDSKLTDQGLNLQTQVANLLVNGSVTYNRDEALSLYQKGVVEVLLALPQSHIDRKERFIAFSSPFKTMYADYFSYCMLGRPTNAGLFGASKTSIWRAEHPLKSGEGYIVGQDVFADDEEYYKNRSQYSGARFSDRLGDLLTLNRYVFDIKGSSINITKATIGANAYNNEEIQTEDVIVNLGEGFNYLGNPYTAPLDITSLLQNESGITDPWKISRSQGNDGTHMYAAVYVMDQMKSIVTNAAQHKFTVNATWKIAQAVGSTYTRNGIDVPSIAPMQLFAVWNESGTSMTIPKSQRKHRNTNFLRNSNEPIDELLLEVVDSDTKGYDRVCVVFRPNASLKAGDPYDAYKMFNNSGDASQIYNLSEDGSDMVVNVVPSNLKSMTISLAPAKTTKEVTLSAYRLNSLVSPKGVWLEDLKTKQYIDLETVESYTFNTNPTDNTNRFVLHFDKIPTATNPLNTSSLHAYYQNSTLNITGITTTDIGSKLSIYDLQGRIVLNTNIRETGIYTIPMQLQKGIYLVKIAGKNNLTTKFICK